MSDEFLRDRQLESEACNQDEPESERFPHRNKPVVDQAGEAEAETNRRLSGDFTYVGRLALYEGGRYIDSKTGEDITDKLEEIAKEASEFRKKFAR